MADFNSSLPVRTETDGDIVAKITDGVSNLLVAVDGSATPANGLLVLGTDGTDAQALSTDVSGNLNVNIVSGASGHSDTDDGSIAGAQVANLGVSLNYGWNGTTWGRLNVDGSGNLDIKVNAALPTGTNSIGTVGLDAGSNNIGDLGTIIDLENTDGSAVGTKGILAMGTDGTNAQTIATNASGALKVVQDSGEIFEVHLTNQTSSDEVHHYEQETAVAAAGTSTATYTVTAARTLLLMSIFAGASGKGRCEVAVGPTGSEVTKAVFFWSASNLGNQIYFSKPIEVAATDNVKLTLKNMDNQTQDMYSFINGEEVA